jgi:ATP-dependent Lon protease
VEFAGYTEREKAEIAKKYLIPRQIEESGLKSKNVVFTDDAVMSIVSKYTRESGVRQLERQVGAVARKVARKLASGGTDDLTITPEDVRELLGRPRVHPERANEENEIGVAAGMYYTPMGGDIMFVEAAIRRLHGAQRATDSPDDKVQVSGWGNVSLILTGQLGDVMKESARAALTYAATHASALKIPEDRLGSIEVHVHVPAGAIPKDGPSAGVAISTALVSAMSGAGAPRRRDDRRDHAARPRAADRRLKEEVIGAHRAGIKHIILRRTTRRMWMTIPEEVRKLLPSTVWPPSTRRSPSRSCHRRTNGASHPAARSRGGRGGRGGGAAGPEPAGAIAHGRAVTVFQRRTPCFCSGSSSDGRGPHFAGPFFICPASLPQRHSAEAIGQPPREGSIHADK